MISTFPNPAPLTIPHQPASLFRDERTAYLPRQEQSPAPDFVLKRSPLGGPSEVMACELFDGGAFPNIDQPPRGESALWANRTVFLYSGIAKQLDKELSKRPSKPRAVHLCPGSDAFSPYLAAQQETLSIVDVLANHGVQTWITTRGHIRPAILDQLCPYRDFIKFRIGITTMERSVQRILEPWTAPPEMRLRQIAKLRSLEFSVQVAVEPMVPGVTDDRQTLQAILDALGDIDVRRITAGYLSIPVGAEEYLHQLLDPHGWSALVLDGYRDGFVQRKAGAVPIRYLPKSRRQRGYAQLMSLASRCGIAVGISSVTNPDFSRVSQEKSVEQPRLRFLFSR